MTASGRVGWWYPGVAAIGIACGVTALLVTIFSYFVVPMTTELRLTAADLSVALSFHLAGQVLGFPVAGVVVDRFGPRWVLAGSGLLFAAGLALVPWVAADWGTLWVTLAAAGFLGAAAGPIAYASIIVRRFEKSLGLALGIALSGAGLGSIALPATIAAVIRIYGWEAGWWTLAGIALVASLLGSVLAGRSAHGSVVREAIGGDWRSVLGSDVFWRMSIAFAALGIVTAGILGNFASIWNSLGSTGAPAWQALMGASAIVGRIAGGALLDRFDSRRVAAAAASVGALGIVLLASLPPQAALTACAIAFIGWCTGAEGDAVSYLSARYFGVELFARAYGMAALIFMCGFALGPVAFSSASSVLGLKGALMSGTGMLLVTTGLLLTLPPVTPASAAGR